MIEDSWSNRLTAFAILNYKVCHNLRIPSRVMINEEAEEIKEQGLRFFDQNYLINLPGVFEPIPLTAEILDCTAFKKINEGVYSANTDTGISITLVLMEDFCLFRFGRVEYKFKYFNELQYFIHILLPGGAYRWYNIKKLFPDRIFCEVGAGGKIKISKYEKYERVAKNGRGM